MTEVLSEPTSRGGDYGFGNVTAITLAAGSDTTIKRIPIPPGATWLGVEIKNSHATSVAFDTFIITRRFHASGNWETIANAAGDFTSPQSPIIEASASPVTLAQNALVYLRIQVEATESVRFQASGAAAESTAELRYRLG